MSRIRDLRFDRCWTLFHLSPDRNLQPILSKGLLPSLAATRPWVWLFAWEMRQWALKHVATHQDCPQAELALFRADVPFEWVSKIRSGIYICTRIIEPARLTHCVAWQY